MNHYFLKLVMIAFIIIGFSHCGVISKTRYGNGFKLNLEFGQKAKQIDSNYFKSITARKALRKQKLKEKISPTTAKSEVSQEKLPNESLYNAPTLSHDSIQLDLGSNNLPLINYCPEDHLKHPLGTSKPAVKHKEDSKIEYEKNAKAAGFVFYGSLLFIPILGPLALVGMLVGFILAITALKRIKEAQKNENKKLKGKGLATSIIILFTLGLYLVGFLIYIIITEPSWFYF